MSWVKRIVACGRRLLRHEQAERELEAEVESYFEILVGRLVAQGLSHEEAVRRARLHGRTGTSERESQAGAAGIRSGTAARDVRYAWRTLLRSPGFTAVAVLTLALGIGANAAIFNLIDAVMLQLLPVEHPEQLVLLTDPNDYGELTETTQHGVRTILSYKEFDQLRSNKAVFSGMLAAQDDVSDVNVLLDEGSREAQTLRAHAQLVSGSFFDVLGVRPVLGRVFTSDEDKTPGANPVTVISYGYWRRMLGGNPGVIGSTVRVGKGDFRIIGIAPPGFRGILVGFDADFWFPLSMQREVLPGRDYLEPLDTIWLQVMGRLAPGMSIQRAQAGINLTFQQALRVWAAPLPTPRQRREMVHETIRLQPGNRAASLLRGKFADPLTLLMAMVGVVLLIACANIANLMLVRATGRQREIGVRLALGAARFRIVRQLLTESLLVAGMGGLLGLLLSLFGARLLLGLVSTGVSDLTLNVAGNYHVVAFTAGISILTLVFFGLMPALRGTSST